jgi:hypothetical protein
MRFFADGPSIPDELLEQRDHGNVVFFCGAGVSRPAGLPTFVELARAVLRRLGTAADSEIRSVLEQGKGENLDRVFNLLEHDYRREEVEERVTEILRIPRNANAEPHRIILRLSRNASNGPQIVTTNFDHLFERADKSLAVHVAPALPDLATVGSFQGIVYLHGRCLYQPSRGKTALVTERRLILSSSDFGRAYLADGWATRFVRDLLRHYTIVLVGYSASDAPVKYLLEGLHTRAHGERSTIYALDEGEKDVIVSRWRSLGVTGLPYQASDKQHSNLWETLRAWADRADDLQGWRRSIASMACSSPAELQPFQRGQVASLVTTAEGAAVFASADPPPHAEWLCVFDKYVRYAVPDRSFGQQEPDPQECYGLDDDPPRPPEAPNTAEDIPGRDFLAALTPAERESRHRRLAGVSTLHGDSLSARLAHLGSWVAKVASQPAAAWWAAGYEAVHPQFLRAIEWQHTNGKAPEGIYQKVWLLLLERYRHAPPHHHDEGWYPFTERLKREGWIPGVFRDFERAVMPYLTAKRATRLRPPLDSNVQDMGDVVRFELRFPGYDHGKLDIGSAALPTVFEILRRALLRAAMLLAEIERDYWRTASFVWDGEPEERHLNEPSKFLHWMRALFDRLAAEAPAAARAELRAWPVNERYFFTKLSLHAYSRSDVCDATEIADKFRVMSSACFWDESYRRELLHALRARWKEFSDAERSALEARIVAGSERWSNESDEDHLKRIGRTTMAVFGWLEANGCELSENAHQQLAALRPEFPDSQRDPAPDRSLDSRVGWVGVDAEPAALLVTPLAQTIAAAFRQESESAFSRTQRMPFRGLVQQHTRRALAALRASARIGDFNGNAWRQLLSDWPEASSDRLVRVCAGRIVTLPDSVLENLTRETADWFEKHAPRFAGDSATLAYAVFDRLVDVLSAAGEGSTESGLGEASVGGVVLRRSRRTHEHAINGPVGSLTDGLIALLDRTKPASGTGIPQPLRVRLERLLQLPGPGGDHAVCQSMLQLPWLHNVDPAWTTGRLVPLLAPDHPMSEPAWNGLLHNTRLPGATLFSRIRNHFLQMFEVAQSWQWEEDTRNQAVNLLLVACYWNLRSRSYIDYDDARKLLRLVSDESRAHAIWFLASAFDLAKDWKTFGRPFLRRAWPRETRFQTGAVSRQFAFLAERAGDHFPDVVNTVLPLIVPVDRLDVTIHGAIHGDERTLASRFPHAMLALLDALIPENPTTYPYELATALDQLSGGANELTTDPRFQRLRRIADRA